MFITVSSRVASLRMLPRQSDGFNVICQKMQIQRFDSLNSSTRLVLEESCALINVSVEIFFSHMAHCWEGKALQPLKQEDALSPGEWRAPSQQSESHELSATI